MYQTEDESLNLDRNQILDRPLGISELCIICVTKLTININGSVGVSVSLPIDSILRVGVFAFVHSAPVSFRLVCNELMEMEQDDEKFFYEDEVAMVCARTGQVKYGLVLSTIKSLSNYPTPIQEYRRTGPSNMKVVWHPNGTEEVIMDDKVYYFQVTTLYCNVFVSECMFLPAQVVLMDRSLMPGDVVRKVNNKNKPGQFGYCENIEISATVKILNTNKVIENISSRHLKHTKVCFVFIMSPVSIFNDLL